MVERSVVTRGGRGPRLIEPTVSETRAGAADQRAAAEDEVARLQSRIAHLKSARREVQKRVQFSEDQPLPRRKSNSPSKKVGPANKLQQPLGLDKPLNQNPNNNLAAAAAPPANCKKNSGGSSARSSTSTSGASSSSAKKPASSISSPNAPSTTGSATATSEKLVLVGLDGVGVTLTPSPSPITAAPAAACGGDLVHDLQGATGADARHNASGKVELDDGGHLQEEADRGDDVDAGDEDGDTKDGAGEDDDDDSEDDDALRRRIYGDAASSSSGGEDEANTSDEEGAARPADPTPVVAAQRSSHNSPREGARAGAPLALEMNRSRHKLEAIPLEQLSARRRLEQPDIQKRVGRPRCTTESATAPRPPSAQEKAAAARKLAQEALLPPGVENEETASTSASAGDGPLLSDRGTGATSTSAKVDSQPPRNAQHRAGVSKILNPKPDDDDDLLLTHQTAQFPPAPRQHSPRTRTKFRPRNMAILSSASSSDSTSSTGAGTGGGSCCGIRTAVTAFIAASREARKADRNGEGDCIEAIQQYEDALEAVALLRTAPEVALGALGKSCLEKAEDCAKRLKELKQLISGEPLTPIEDPSSKLVPLNYFPAHRNLQLQKRPGTASNVVQKISAEEAQRRGVKPPSKTAGVKPPLDVRVRRIR
mmetsp:Transcript_9745/g.24044  ORF Transcript_9745/g.24044 Transcript_9745/m.24044 type:complete len:654 (+) Transcript_9745:61-2022(+)